MGKVITSVSDEDQEVFKFFSKHSPCWFDGCAHLRVKWFRDLARIEAAKCPACHKGRLMRKYYIPEIKRLLKTHHGKDISTET